jgi:hypothetical protein
MHRCPTGPKGKFKVELMVLHHDEPYHVQIGSHHDVIAHVDGRARVMEHAPWVGNEHPYEGELCEHELQFLDGLPGKDYRPEYKFTVTPLK